MGLAIFLISPIVMADQREDVDFAVDFNTSPGQSVYVVGDIPELGDGDASRAPKLEPSAFPSWRATVAIPAGTDFTYEYIWRNDSVTQWSNPANENPIRSPIAGSTAPVAIQPGKKGFYYYSGWTQPTLFWRTDENESFTEQPMQEFGDGRFDGEQRWRAIGVGQGERWIEFYLTDGASGRDPSVGTYRTKLDAFLVQDGQVFGYQPAPSVTTQRRDYTPANPPGINSANLGEFRRYRVFLPRGYDNHPEKRYPVIYMHDGQNLFEFGPFGSWRVDLALSDATRNGRMREVIVVGIDNTANRARDYITPDDIVPIGPGFGQPGRADDYAAFIINELKPIIDAKYRTLPDRDNTGTIGSSLGGVVSLYLGWDFNDTFARSGPMSGSWWLNNFPTRVLSEPNRDIRLYMDSGDCCTPSFDSAWATLNLRDGLLEKGYVLHRDLFHTVGYGDQHNEAAWASRVGVNFEFLFPTTEAENPLLNEIFTGDLDGDGDIDGDDFLIFEPCVSESGGAPTAECQSADLDGSGVVDCQDADVFATYWSGDAPPPIVIVCAATGVPATSTTSLIMMLVAVIIVGCLVTRSRTTANVE